MLGAILAAALVSSGTPPTPDPSALVARLGSPRFAQREAAEGDLARLGRAALPALRAARDAQDPEIRARARLLVKRIEAAVLLEPTPIVFDFQDVPIGEAIRAINRRSGLSLTLGDPSSPEPRVTLRSAGPLPFWKGIDALCGAGGLHPAAGESPMSGRDGGTFVLWPGAVAAGAPTSDHGPFRVLVASVHASSEIQFQGSATDPARQFYLQLLVAAEPRLSATQDGPARITEAVDERGRSLLVADRPGLSRPSGVSYGMNPTSTVRLRVDLAHPGSTGGRIARLRGQVPLVVAGRKADPLEVPLAGAPGREFAGDDAVLIVRGSNPARDGRPAMIELSIRSTGPGEPAVDSGDGEPLAYRPDSTRQQLEVLDARGRVLPWFPAGISYNDGETRLKMTLPGRDDSAGPATLRYHGILRAAVDVPFEFRDVPIP